MTAAAQLKHCSKCGHDKPLEAFCRSSRHSTGHHSWCRQCNKDAQAERRLRQKGEGVKRCSRCDQDKPRIEFRSSRRADDGLAEWCQQCACSANRPERKRRREVRARTISVRRMAKRELEIERRVSLRLAEAPGRDRPHTRGDCIDAPRPCPYVGCKWNLYLDVNPANGSIKLVFPDLTPDELAETCALDVADRGGETLEKVAELMNITRERVRQIEIMARERIKNEALRGALQARTEADSELDPDDAPQRLQGLDYSDGLELEAFADLLLTQTPPGDREP